jgi:hypothetical protein
MENTLKWIAAVCGVLTLVFGGGWYSTWQQNRRQEAAHQQAIADGQLKPILVLLAQNLDLKNELDGPEYNEPGWGIQESYLIKAKRNGAKANAVMREKIDDLVKNDEHIVVLVEQHLPFANTNAFKQQGTAFIQHAKRYADRWHALPDILETSGDFPTAEPVFPRDFPKAVSDEIDALEKRSSGT